MDRAMRGKYIQAEVWDFSVLMTKRIRWISYLLYTFGLFLKDLSLRSIKTNIWSSDDFKKHVTSMSCTLVFAMQSGDTGQQIPFLTAANWP